MLGLEERAAPFLASIGEGGKLEGSITTERGAAIESAGKSLGGGCVTCAVFYDAITMASQDGGMTEAMAQRAKRLADRLALDSAVSTELMSIADAEASLHERKGKLFIPFLA